MTDRQTDRPHKYNRLQHDPLMVWGTNPYNSSLASETHLHQLQALVYTKPNQQKQNLYLWLSW